ncbi:group II intron maturase-specific domain-containing protein [Fusibacter paucivorans]
MKRKLIGYSFYFETRLKKLIEKTRGWVNYFKLADMSNILIDIDKWVRRRLKACIWNTRKLNKIIDQLLLD